MKKYIATLAFIVGATALVADANATDYDAFTAYTNNQFDFCTESLTTEYKLGVAHPDLREEGIREYTRLTLEAPTLGLRTRTILLSLALEYGATGEDETKLRGLTAVCLATEETK